MENEEDDFSMMTVSRAHGLWMLTVVCLVSDVGGIALDLIDG